jgi:hypothetical protein
MRPVLPYSSFEKIFFVCFDEENFLFLREQLNETPDRE